MVSVIIPIYDEEKILAENSNFFLDLAPGAELIFVDGESSDNSAELAEKYGKVLRSGRSRALQMNSGAREARGNILLFLHADTFVSPVSLESIEKEMKNSSYIGGCFTQRIDKEEAVFRFIESLGNLRARLTGVFYGDQGIFVKKDTFLRIGGFPDVPIMEDVLFTRKLRKSGKTLILDDRILASPRRWEKKGVVETIFLYSMMNVLFWLGFPLRRIRNLHGDLR
ncbi:MAG: TIGR04283 family arsenosugar biosynthesis glycosyltransferase [Candidatus Omnitrophota bacterium]